MRCSAPMVRMPSSARRACIALPTPQIRLTGFGARKATASAAADHREAARLLEVRGDLGEELVVRQADRDGDADLRLDPRREPGERRAAGGAWCSRSVPARSRKASSIEIGSTSGVSSSIRARTSRPTVPYFSMSGGMTTASGQAFSALNIGMAERTPWMRAM